jgi:protoporphyrinogen oxidase
MDKDIVILGAGISGIAAGFYGGEDKTIIYEREDSYGGVCGNFKLDDFTFDKGVHLSFTKNKDVRAIFDKTFYNSFEPHPQNVYAGNWFKHPIQNNLFSLPMEEKIKAIISFFDKDKINSSEENYKEWLYSKYGKYITEEFFLKYTKKYWCEDAENLGISWIENRIYTPNLKEVIYGAMSEDTPNTYYAKEMRYPSIGGYKEFLKPMVDKSNIVLNSRAILLDLKNKIIEFNNGSKVKYNYLISTIPLPELVSISKDINEEIKNKAKALKATSLLMVSLVIEGELNFNDIWFYIYDEDILPARAYLPGKKSINNIKKGYSAIQFEIYYSESKPIKISNEMIINNIYSFLEKMKLTSKRNIILSDMRSLDYANVIFYENTTKNRDFIIDFYEKNDIYSIGRFGQWDYLWSDQSLLSGKTSISKIKSKMGN